MVLAEADGRHGAERGDALWGAPVDTDVAEPELPVLVRAPAPQLARRIDGARVRPAHIDADATHHVDRARDEVLERPVANGAALCRSPTEDPIVGRMSAARHRARGHSIGGPRRYALTRITDVRVTCAVVAEAAAGATRIEAQTDVTPAAVPATGAALASSAHAATTGAAVGARHALPRHADSAVWAGFGTHDGHVGADVSGVYRRVPRCVGACVAGIRIVSGSARRCEEQRQVS